MAAQMSHLTRPFKLLLLHEWPSMPSSQEIPRQFRVHSACMSLVVLQTHGKAPLIGYVWWQAMVSCAFNGLGLALVIPCVQSLVADYHPSEARGQAFGLMGLTSSFGEAPLTFLGCSGQASSL